MGVFSWFQRERRSDGRNLEIREKASQMSIEQAYTILQMQLSRPIEDAQARIADHKNLDGASRYEEDYTQVLADHFTDIYHAQSEADSPREQDMMNTVAFYKIITAETGPSLEQKVQTTQVAQQATTVQQAQQVATRQQPTHQTQNAAQQPAQYVQQAETHEPESVFGGTETNIDSAIEKHIKKSHSSAQAEAERIKALVEKKRLDAQLPQFKSIDVMLNEFASQFPKNITSVAKVPSNNTFFVQAYCAENTVITPTEKGFYLLETGGQPLTLGISPSIYLDARSQSASFSGSLEGPATICTGTGSIDVMLTSQIHLFIVSKNGNIIFDNTHAIRGVQNGMHCCYLAGKGNTMLYLHAEGDNSFIRVQYPLV